ncbi:MAG: hypothetical protein JRN37_03285 [Nitrososphaerota archaeon]|nr:hypothetical protein [Nitrososphaerota archaeon]MDG7046885.1 hypothetical protein [Nitrososphaerota archaeon]
MDRLAMFQVASVDCDAEDIIGITNKGVDEKFVSLCQSLKVKIIDNREKPSADKIRTGLDCLDKMTAGGLKRGGVYSITGRPGTGLSTFAALFLAAGARFGEKGLIIKTDTSAADFLVDMDAFDIGFRQYVNAGMIRVIEVSDKVRAMKYDLINGKGDYRMYITRLSNEIMQIISKAGITRLVVDTVNPLIIPNDDFIHLFISAIRYEGVTTLLMATAPSYEMLEAYVTGSILLEYGYEGDSMVRKLTITKMRGAQFTSRWVYYTIDKSGFRALKEGEYFKENR